MHFTRDELNAISDALSELRAGPGPQGARDAGEAQRTMNAAASAQIKIHAGPGSPADRLEIAERRQIAQRLCQLALDWAERNAAAHPAIGNHVNPALAVAIDDVERLAADVLRGNLARPVAAAGLADRLVAGFRRWRTVEEEARCNCPARTRQVPHEAWCAHVLPAVTPEEERG